jgi:hypothetical protein
VQAFDVPATPAEQKKLARLVKKPLPNVIHHALFTYGEFLRGLGRMSLSTPNTRKFC